VTVGATAARRRSQSGTDLCQRAANLRLRYKIYRDTPPPPSGRLVVNFTTTFELGAGAIVMEAPGRGQAASRTDHGKTSSEFIDVIGAGMDESSITNGWVAGPTMRPVYAGLTWTNFATGQWYTYVNVDTKDLAGYAKAIWNGGVGNATVVSAGADAGLDINFASAQDSVERAVQGTIVGGIAEGVTLETYTETGVLLEALSHVVEANGAYYLPFAVDGTYRIYFTPPGALRMRRDVTVTSEGVTGIDFNVKWGDVDGNNLINQVDLDFITASLGITSTQAEYWIPGPNGLMPKQADLNHDNQVSSTDLAMATANLGAVGD